ncbi:MAG: M56 family metallopeptidase [Ferruginibacter sp.]
MPFPVFEQLYLLQSLGWAIANSFWQTGILWLLYQLIIRTDKNIPAIAKHHLSLMLLSCSFIWFLFTFLKNYVLLTTGVAPDQMVDSSWMIKLSSINNMFRLLSLVYLALLLFYIANFFSNLTGNRLLRNSGLTRAPIDFRLFTDRTALHLGINKKIKIWLSAHVDVPCVTGFINPVILFPVALINHLSIQQIEAVLLHELAHIKRNDYLINFIQSIIEMVLFFNPFAVLLSKAARKERENCCDDWVLNFRYDQYEYAKALLLLEEQRHLLQFRFAIAATNGHKKLLERVKRLFNVTPQTGFSAIQKFKLTGLSLLILVNIFIVIPLTTQKSVREKAVVPGKKQTIDLTQHNKQRASTMEKALFATTPLKPERQYIEKGVTFTRTRKIKKLPENNPSLNMLMHTLMKNY